MKYGKYVALAVFGFAIVGVGGMSYGAERKVSALMQVREKTNPRDMIDGMLLNDEVLATDLKDLPDDGSNRTVLQKLIIKKSRGFVPDLWDGEQTISVEPVVAASRMLLHAVRAAREYCTRKNLNFAQYVNHQDFDGNTALHLLLNPFVANGLDAFFWKPPMGYRPPKFTPDQQTAFTNFLNDVKLMITVLISGGADVDVRNGDNRTSLEDFMVFRVFRLPFYAGSFRKLPKLRVKKNEGDAWDAAYSNGIRMIVDAFVRGGVDLAEELNNAVRIIAHTSFNREARVWSAYEDYINYFIDSGVRLSMNPEEFRAILRSGDGAPMLVLKLVEAAEDNNDKYLSNYLCRNISREDVLRLINRGGGDLVKKFVGDDFFAKCPSVIQEGMEAAYPTTAPTNIPSVLTELIGDYTQGDYPQEGTQQEGGEQQNR